tara:strand:- start:1873 stop:2667 length:795 start_codon:yes stop_codon:yes gene_type:complete
MESKQLNFAILNIDKPQGPTSFAISSYIKKALNLPKTAHFGTLDPQVTGVLPVALGRACRLNEYFMHRDKTYVGIMRLHEEISELKLKAEMKKFIGKIKQLPPVRSSVKRAVREREVKTFEIIEKQDKDVLFKTQVQAGTYIRKLIHDLGLQIGGAHMLELRRVKAGIFNEENSITLYDFEKALKENNLSDFLIPAQEAIKEVLPQVQLKSGSLSQLLMGKPLHKGDVETKEDVFALFQKEKFIGIYRKTKDEFIIARPEFVYN